MTYIVSGGALNSTHPPLGQTVHLLSSCFQQSVGYRISNVANVAYTTGLALLGPSRHPKFKRIKDAQRSTMNQNRLNNLTLMSMEYELYEYGI